MLESICICLSDDCSSKCLFHRAFGTPPTVGLFFAGPFFPAICPPLWKVAVVVVVVFVVVVIVVWLHCVVFDALSVGKPCLGQPRVSTLQERRGVQRASGRGRRS